MRWYIHDSEERRLEAVLDEACVETIRTTLGWINMYSYARNLVALGQLPSDDITLHLEWNEESLEIAAIIHYPEVVPAVTDKLNRLWCFRKDLCCSRH